MMMRYECMFMAKLAEQAHRYKDMAELMDELVLSSAAAFNELTQEERNLLAAAYKHLIDPLRQALLTIEHKDPVHIVTINKYKTKVESELSQVCARMLSLLDLHLIPSASTNKSKVFYLKTKGDYHRYLAEFKVGLEREIAAEDAMLTYKTAEKIACAHLSPTNHVREALEDAVEKRDALGHKFCVA
ncbi:G-box regulating factor 6 [Actinidia rufa]|uniref:G-box regulating factor 6 n=1 Tax=Actinidia rufa TaxID=165716 RepID=A0A7J0FS63_9ERIC|nr:G-box regulating factor 6 [Actinidia rufa]